MGDSVDNVPGVPGDRAEDRVAADPANLATSRRCWPRADEITKPKLKQSLIEHADMARLSRELVRLVCDAALPEPLDALALTGIPQGAAEGVPRGPGVQGAAGADGRRRRRAARQRRCRHDVIARAGRRAGRARRSPSTAAPMRRSPISSQLDRWIAEARAQGFVAVDTETDCIDCVVAQAGRDQPGDRAQQGLLHPGRAWRRRPLFRRAEPVADGDGAGAAEAAARGPGGAQDRPQPQIRLGDVRQARDRGRAVRRHAC